MVRRLTILTLLVPAAITPAFVSYFARELPPGWSRVAPADAEAALGAFSGYCQSCPSPVNNTNATCPASATTANCVNNGPVCDTQYDAEFQPVTCLGSYTGSTNNGASGYYQCEWFGGYSCWQSKGDCPCGFQDTATCNMDIATYACDGTCSYSTSTMCGTQDCTGS